MNFNEICILIPSHSLEDFPTDLPEPQAAGLLNVFSAAWHPQLLVQCEKLPQWARADDPPAELDEQLILVCPAIQDWLPHDWVETARTAGATILESTGTRDELVQQIDQLVSPPDSQPLDPDLLADFLALGTCYLQIELLTRHMHYFSNIDESTVEREALAAARAAVNHDTVAAKSHLQSCFESLTDARERFYPVDCYLIDLCLLIPSLADDHLTTLLESQLPTNLLVNASDLEQIAEERPQAITHIRKALETGTLSVLGGDRHERPVPLVPLERALYDLLQGRECYRRILDRAPTTWARRRFGFSTMLPQILSRSGFEAALHVALDDGLYPDQEQSKIQWEGCDGTVIDALTRIPLAGDSASSYLRLPMRMAETMEQDHVAALVLARWPELKTPWLGDLQRMHKYAPVLGRLVTFGEFFDQAESPGRLTQFAEQDYLSPFMVQFVAAEDPDGITRFRFPFELEAAWQSAEWTAQLNRLIRATPLTENPELESAVDDAGPDGDQRAFETLSTVRASGESQLQQLAELLLTPTDASAADGMLILNTRSFPRRVAVTVPLECGQPAAGGPVLGSQQHAGNWHALVELPAAGFAWFPLEANPQPDAERDDTPLAEENMLRNEFFEVHINTRTGGIEQVKEYGRKPNRLSQQLAYRFLTEQTVPAADEDSEPETTFYSVMRCTDWNITSTGPLMGEISTRGTLNHPGTDRQLAEFEQTVRVWKGRRTFDIEIRLTHDEKPQGSPWATYFASRFAYSDSLAALTRSVLETAQPLSMDRFESPHFVEIATETERTTVLTHGLSFHRKTGPRMLDTILVCEGETANEFRFSVAVDHPYPMEAAHDVMTPALSMKTTARKPAGPSSAWLFRLDRRNVQLTRLLPPIPIAPSHEHADEVESGANELEPVEPADCRVRLLETEGQSRPVRLECFRSIRRAVKVDLEGRHLLDLPVVDGAVTIALNGYELCDLCLSF